MRIILSRCSKRCMTKDTTGARSMAPSVYGPEPVFAPIRRLKICQSRGKWIFGLQIDSGSDLNRAGAVSRVSRRLGTAATGPEAKLKEGNRQRGLDGLSVEQAILGGRKSQGLLLPKTTAETTLINNKRRTINAISSSIFTNNSSGYL